jgi:hypothetical protein
VSDIRLLSLPENIQVNKIDLPSEIQNYTADWQPATMFSKDPDNPNIEITTESVKVKKEYELMKERIYNAIAPDSNPRAQVSVLGDNGAFDVSFYYTDEEYNQKYDELFSKLQSEKEILGQEITEDDLNNIDMSLVRMGVDENNMYNPDLTEGQRQAVKDFISNQIDMTTEDKITKNKSLEYQIDLETKKFEQSKDKGSSGGSSGGPTKSEIVDATAAKQLKNLFNKKTVAATNLINDYLDSGYKLVLLNNGSYKLQQLQNAGDEIIRDQKTNKIIPTEKVWKDVKTFRTFDTLNRYVSWSSARDAVKTGSEIGGELDN